MTEEDRGSSLENPTITAVLRQHAARGEPLTLTEEQLDRLVDRVAEKAARRAMVLMTQEMYQTTGKFVLKGVLRNAGMLFVAYAIGRGWVTTETAAKLLGIGQ